MLFTDIRLQNFRSYTEDSYELGSGVNIIVGPNAAGKTSLLEALMLNATGKSYKASDYLLIKSNKDWSRIDTHTSTNQIRTVKLKIEQDKAIKTFEIDNKLYKKLTPNVKQPVVLFEPQDLNLLVFEPANRRDYIDFVIEQFNSSHAQAVTKLKRALAQRNKLLKMPNLDKSQLFIWDVRLSEIAGEVVANRIKLIDTINQKLQQIYSSIAGANTRVNLVYASKINPANYSTNLLNALEKNIEIDRIRGFSSFGPHRDDVVAYFGDKPMVDSASRGENRTLVLSLKILELEILENETSKRPLLLLDDVFSELDGSRRRALTEYIKMYQTLITTTDADAIMRDFAKDTNKIVV